MEIDEFLEIVKKVDTTNPMQAKAMALITQQFFHEQSIKTTLGLKNKDMEEENSSEATELNEDLTLAMNMTDEAMESKNLLKITQSLERIMSMSSLMPLMDPKVVYGRIVRPIPFLP